MYKGPFQQGDTSMKRFFWPWSEIAELREIAERQRSRLFNYSTSLSETKLRLANAEIEIDRLRGLLAKATFRDPVTGRFVRKPR